MALNIDNALHIVSQFTLQGKTVKGNKPDFHNAMKTEQAKATYAHFLDKLGKAYDPAKIKGTEENTMSIFVLTHTLQTVSLEP